MDTAQTVAQAVQAATQQAAQAAAAAAAAAAASPVQASSTPTSAIDNLTCQWQGCGERCDTAEALYDHVCERHVGRKSTNNLNLTCQWGACRTTTVKRDHITSHIRVHVPLKPHKCDFCGKSFKRPQDLKKHVKTHADDTVLTNSPAPTGNGRNMGAPPNMGPNAQPSYYPTHDNPMGNPYPGYQHTLGSNGATAGAYTQAGGNQYGAYGSVSYPNSASIDIHSLDTRRRAIEALNDFLGDIKRRALNPHQYMDVGQRLGVGNALPLPVGGGYNTGYSGPAAGVYGNTFSAAALLDSFNHSDGMGGGGLHGPMSHGGYSLPLSNARSKNDLQDIDRFLEQLQQTVYETSNHAAAAGVQQPGVHAQYTGDFGFNNHYQARSSGSPTSFQQATTGAAAFGGLTAATMPGMTVASSTSIETPALTPASVSSYSSSGHSPLSSNGRNSFGNLTGNAMYPNLPAVTGISDLGTGYPTTTSAPPAGLASGFDGLDGRRYSGGRLQRQAPTQDSEMTDAGAEDGNRTPRPEAASSQRSKNKGNSSIDPALRGDESSDSAGTPAADDKRQEDWVENIRTIESLRRWIADRLARGDYEEDAGGEPGNGTNAADDDKTSVDIAKLVESAMRSGEQEVKDESGMGAEGEVKYPSLSVT